MKLLTPLVFGSGSSAAIFTATGSMRVDGMVLFANGRPVSGSRIAVVKTPLRSARVMTFPVRSTPCSMRVPS